MVSGGDDCYGWGKPQVSYLNSIRRLKPLHSLRRYRLKSGHTAVVPPPPHRFWVAVILCYFPSGWESALPPVHVIRVLFRIGYALYLLLPSSLQEHNPCTVYVQPLHAILSSCSDWSVIIIIQALQLVHSPDIPED